MHLRRRLSIAMLALAAGRLAAAESTVGRVNTLWVIPAEQYAWIDPMSAKLVAGGGLYLLLANARMRDLRASADDAFAFLEAHPELCPGYAEGRRQWDMWISIGDEQQPRGGPSAGVAFAILGYSAMAGLPVRNDFAVTGEIVRETGAVRGVGGIPYKLRAVEASGIRTFCIPADGAPALEDLSYRLVTRVRVVTIAHVSEAFFEAFGYDGPEAQRYDRVMALWNRVHDGMARRAAVQTRLALDELLELVPNDLSAARLWQFYQNVDLAAAAENLFADAQQYERDGLPDIALTTARRAYGYADAETRARYLPLIRRLEVNQLDPEARALLRRAEEQALAQQVGEAWRTLQQARQLAADNPFLAGYAEAWQPYAAVAQLESALAGNPTDTGIQIALARALGEAKAWRAAAERWAALRRAEPDNPRWLTEQVRAYAAGELPAEAAGVLREAREAHPETVAELLAEYQLELDPPSLECSPLETVGQLATAVVRSVDAGGLPELRAAIDGQQLVALRSSPAELTVDLGLLAAGEHELRLSSVDRFGNEAAVTLTLTAPDDGPPTCLRRLDPPARPAAPGEVAIRPGRAVVPRGTRLVIDPAVWLADQAARLSELRVDDLSVAGPPWRLTVPTAGRGPGEHELVVTATDRDGIEHRESARVTITEQPAVWLAQPAEGLALTGSVSVIVGMRDELRTQAVALWLDGWPHRAAAPGERMTLTADSLPAGEHVVWAEVIADDGTSWWTPPVTLRVERPRPAPIGGADWPPLPPSSLAGLARADLPQVPGLVAVPASPIVRLVRAVGADPPLSPPPFTDTALRLDDGPLPARLVLAAGDALAFVEPPPLEQLGPGAELVPGPLARAVWRPGQIGLYPLQLAERVLVEVVDRPALAIVDPPSGAAPRVPFRLRMFVAESLGFDEVALLSGERVLGRWPVPLPEIWADPLLLPPGDQVLRLAAIDPSGAVHVSPPVVLRID